jgi:RNA polymerase sigma factor (sigma-70 family)
MERWRVGDHEAAQELFRLHAERLIALARSRLSSRLSARVDPEDVVQSAYRSFFVRAREGRFEIEQGGDLWALLVAITIHKVHQQVKRNSAQKRNAAAEERFADDNESQIPAADPTPLEAVALIDQVEELMRRLDPVRRRVLELRLEGWTLEEIAVDTGLSRRTLHRLLDSVKKQLERWQNDAARS